MAQPQPPFSQPTNNGNLSETDGTVQQDQQSTTNTLAANHQQNGLPQNIDDRTIQRVAPPPNDNQTPDQAQASFFKEIRGNLMIVAILAAGSTYQAGLNPPGGDWQDDQGHVAGTPILHDKFFDRYQTFFYCNAISFLSSLVIIILLMNKHFYLDMKMVKVLEITLVLDLFSFMAAYAVGSCRRISSSIYVFLLMGVVFLYVLSFARHYSVMRERLRSIGSCTRV